MQSNQQNSSVHFQNFSAYLHREKTTFAIKFSKWESVLISLIGAKLTIYQATAKEKEVVKSDKQKCFSYNLADFDIKMSKKVSQFQKKSSFGIILDEQKLIFGFDSEKTAQKVYQKLKQASKKKQKANQNAEHSQQSRENSKIVQEEQLNLKNSEESQMFQDIINSQWFSDEGNSQFAIHKNVQSGRLLIHKSNKNLIKASFLIQNFRCQLKDEFKFKALCLILDSYLNATIWNMQIEQNSKICAIDWRSFLIYTKIKKQSMVSYARQAVQLVIVEKEENNSQINLYITSEIQSHSNQNPSYFKIDNQQIQKKIDDIASSKNVKMDVKQKIRIGIDSQDSSAVLLFEIKSEMKFNGYNRAQDDSAMNAKYFQSFDRLNQMVQNLLNSQLSSQAQINDKKLQFMDQYFKNCLKQLRDTDKQEKSKPRQTKKEIRETSQAESKTEQQNIPEQSRQERYIRILRKANKLPFSLKDAEQLVKLIKSKEHQNYYLKHRFQEQSLSEIEQFRHSTQQPDHFVFQNGDWRFDQNRQLYFDNQEIIQANKQIGKFLLKQFGSNILKGQNIMSMSLPVQIFDDKSLLQRVAIGFGHAANYLTQAALIEDPLQQFKLVAKHLLAGPLLHIKNTKPFNPILGQTFQCRVGGIHVYLQQISHHPPITAYLAKTQTMQVYGQAQTFVEFGFNAVHARNHTFLRVNFPKTKSQYKGGESEVEFGGIMFGRKYQRYNGKAFIHQKNNNLYAEWSFGKSRKDVYPKQPKQKMKRNDINGGIFKVNKGLGQRLWNQKNKMNFEGVKSQQVQKALVWIHGCWTGDIYFDNDKVKSFQNPIPFKVQRLDYVLPSDCNLRADVIYKRCGNNKKSQQAKQQLQNIQRRDRKLRENTKKVK